MAISDTGFRLALRSLGRPAFLAFFVFPVVGSVPYSLGPRLGKVRGWLAREQRSMGKAIPVGLRKVRVLW